MYIFGGNSGDAAFLENANDSGLRVRRRPGKLRKLRLLSHWLRLLSHSTLEFVMKYVIKTVACNFISLALQFDPFRKFLKLFSNKAM